MEDGMYRKEIISYVLSICLVFLACLLHALDFYHLLSFPVHTLVFILYSFVIFLWIRNMTNRVLRSSVVTRFKLIGFLLISYLLVRTIKYEIFINNHEAVRFIRYLYFVFPLVLTQLIFITSLHVGKSERENISKYRNLLWLPTLLFSILTISNNYHGLVFSLDPSLNGLSQYGPVFYLVLIYIGLLSLATIGLTLVYSFKNRYLTSVKLPIFIILVWGVYTFLYMLGLEAFEHFKIIFKSAEFNILMVILFIESLVFKRLLPSNRGYESFLHLSSLNIGIMDSDGKLIFRPKDHQDTNPSLIFQALDQPILIDKNTLLESYKINGGISFYFLDLSDFNKLKEKLLNLNDEILSENEILKANNSLKKNMIKVEEQREIRDYINKKLKLQFDQLKEILLKLPDDEYLFEKSLKHACFISVYIKRYSNLFLLTKNKNTLDLGELRLAFAESLDYLKLSNVISSIDWHISGSYNSNFCLTIYEIFQNTLEFYMPKVDAIHLNLRSVNERPCLRMKIIGPNPKSFVNNFKDTYVNEGVLIKEVRKKDLVVLELSPKRRQA